MNNFASLLKKLNFLLDRKRKIYLLIVFLMSILLSIIETAGVSVIMPFISVASNPELIDSGWYKYFFDLFNFVNKNSFIITFGVIIILFYLFRSVFNIVYTYFLNKFTLGTFRHFASRLFKTYLALPYRVFVQKNPSVFGQMISSEANNSSGLLLNFLLILTESFTVLFLYLFMLFVNWHITLVLTVVLIFIVYLVFVTLIQKSKIMGKKRYLANVNLTRTLWETFNNFKFIKLKGNEEKIFEFFHNSASNLSQASVISSTLGTIPKNILENLGFSLLIAAVCYIFWRYNSAAMVIPVISMYALALYRMLPAINRILSYFNAIAYIQHSLNSVYNDLNLPTDDEGFSPISFKMSIRAENLRFHYLNGKDVIKDISLEIKAGEKIAFVGESGCGKTTLVDILIGIYRPVQGQLYVDNVLIDQNNIRSWRNKIGYIPQSIYLFDGTVAENVSFGSDRNDDKIIHVLKKAKIWDFLETKEGLNTPVGEGGIQLSGGQKQRIGIARALYEDPEILVLDEATSSLDDETETEIMNEIYDVSGNKTLIIIAHRLSTVKRCNRRIIIEDGVITS
jgi:ATP-binding cassette subfamily B protein/ATP-binding cassette subfamily C protein